MVTVPANSYFKRRTLEGLKFSLIIRSHPCVGIYFVINIFCYTIICHKNYYLNWRNLFKWQFVDTTLLMKCIDGYAIYYVWRILWQLKPISVNLLMIDNLDRFWSDIVIFVFGYVFIEKRLKFLAPLELSGHVNVKNPNVLSNETNFLD